MGGAWWVTCGGQVDESQGRGISCPGHASLRLGGVPQPRCAGAAVCLPEEGGSGLGTMVSFPEHAELSCWPLAARCLVLASDGRLRLQELS